MKKIILMLAVMVCMPLANAYAQEEADAALGKWLTAEGKSHVDIYKCGDKYCGKIVWLKEPFEDDGRPKKDDENKDETLRHRPIMGLKMLWGFKYVGDNTWKKGRIYDPENGKTYKCKMKLVGNMLKVRGSVGPFGRTTEWSRVQ
jgi:uncharacterized protein (DUF2147 family)